ncbi:hypothetical protein HPB50_022297 [Hyalomma asiaticum]|uniref:Uncharacterized protein n=1 Tax=Hyalomma asiaticum TaxID=266040 RepID=A0ACB7TP26_HYAAI|nr:hypothetical protein HPB50_022297 [Hyalomma asiaticum]
MEVSLLSTVEAVLSDQMGTRPLHKKLEDKPEEAVRNAAQAYLVNEYEAKMEKLTRELEDVCKQQIESEKEPRQIYALLLKLPKELIQLIQMSMQYEPELDHGKTHAGDEERLCQQTTGGKVQVTCLGSLQQKLFQAM